MVRWPNDSMAGWTSPDSLPLEPLIAALGLRLDPVQSSEPHHGMSLEDQVLVLW